MSESLTSNPLCAPTKEELIQFLTAWEGVGQLQTFTSREKFRKEARYFIQRLGLPEPPSALRAGDRVEWRGHLGTVTATGVVRVTLDSGHHHTLPVDQLSVTKEGGL